jgi:hypothetical protein
MTNLLYLTISLALVGMVGRALSRSGRAFLGEMFGGQAGVAEAVSRLLVVAFYLLSLGFIALTMQVWSHVGSTGQALQLLSVKIGELLLVLGMLHVASTMVFARLRRARSWPAKADPGGFSPGTAGSDGPDSDDSSASGPGTGRAAAHHTAGPADYPPGASAGARWLPRPGHVIH